MPASHVPVVAAYTITFAILAVMPLLCTITLATLPATPVLWLATPLPTAKRPATAEAHLKER